MYWVQPAFDRGIIGNTCTREKKGKGESVWRGYIRGERWKGMEKIYGRKGGREWRRYKEGKGKGNSENIRRERRKGLCGFEGKD